MCEWGSCGHLVKTDILFNFKIHEIARQKFWDVIENYESESQLCLKKAMATRSPNSNLAKLPLQELTIVT